MPEKKQNTAAVCEKLAEGLAQEMGLTIWDVVFEKKVLDGISVILSIRKKALPLMPVKPFHAGSAIFWMKRTPFPKAIVWRFLPLG